MATVSKETQSVSLTATQHPLDPMTPEEIEDLLAQGAREAEEARYKGNMPPPGMHR